MLSFEWIGDPALATKNVVMLHGILGRKRNLVGFAKRFVSAFQGNRVLLVDLRNHGDSQGFIAPHTLAACAQDLRVLFEHLDIRPKSIIGHSFGAGVAFSYARSLDRLDSLWLLDAIPTAGGSRDLNPEISLILETLQNCPPVQTKADFESKLLSRGISVSMAAWLSMNLKPSEGGLVFYPRPQIAKEMLADFLLNYRIEDFKNLKTKVFFVRAERNLGWKGAIAKPLDDLITTGNSTVFDIPNAGHFVHMDNPEAIIKAMAADFA